MKKTILITGAATGIGQAGAFALGRRGWTVLVHARNPARGTPAVEALQQADPAGDYRLVTGDLADFAQIRALAAQVRASVPRLDVLWNNAGVLVMDRRTSADGWELQMAVNHLAPFLLTKELLPVLAAPGGRIVTTSSAAHRAGRLDLSNWMDEGRRYGGFATYCKTKLANVLFTRELARRLGPDGLTAHCFHPGFVRTEFGKLRDGSSPRTFVDWLSFAQISPERGCDTAVFLADTDLLPGGNGSYWSNRRPRRVRPGNERHAAALWDLSEQATG